MNTVPRLLNTLRPTLADVAKWVKVSRALVDVWRGGTYLPKPNKRAALVTAARKHAAEVLRLAQKVEGEGKPRKSPDTY